MSLRQKICKICIPVRAFSSFIRIPQHSLDGKTISRCVVVVSKTKYFYPSSSNSNIFNFSRCDRFTHCSSKRLQPITSVFSNPSTTETNVNSTKLLYKNVLEAFPGGIQMAFAYGSGAIQQGTKVDKSQNMLDFIFVVDSPEQWHQQNLKKHPDHYSFLRRFGANGLAKFQESYGAGVYFNTLVPMQDRLIKYGVISTDRLITDLLDWESLYISGRLHKPINLIIVPKDEHLLKALVVNLENAVHTALLILPDSFSELQLYTTIASLSYSGDIRMSVAEDNNKISKIVLPNMWMFRRMYLPIVMNEECVVFLQEEGQLEQTLNFESRYHHLTQLPCQVLHGLVIQKYQAGLFPDLEEVICQNAYDQECGRNVSASLKNIVQNSSASQTMKGILTAGLTKSVRYGFSKVMKKVKSS